MSLTRSDLEAGRLQEVVQKVYPAGIFLSEAELQASLDQTLQLHETGSDIWLFAYGSLIWNPVFQFVDRQVGTIYGFHRRFCLSVPAGRGTPEHPGLVLGLDRGGSCRGIAFRIAAADIASELPLVWRREMLTGSYIPRWVSVFDGEQSFKAITFAINRRHRRYVGDLSLEATVRQIATASGHLGSCADYLTQTVNGLLEAGIPDKPLLILHDRVVAYQQLTQNPVDSP